MRGGGENGREVDDNRKNVPEGPSACNRVMNLMNDIGIVAFKYDVVGRGLGESIYMKEDLSDTQEFRMGTRESRNDLSKMNTNWFGWVIEKTMNAYEGVEGEKEDVRIKFKKAS